MNCPTCHIQLQPAMGAVDVDSLEIWTTYWCFRCRGHITYKQGIRIPNPMADSEIKPEPTGKHWDKQKRLRDNELLEKMECSLT